MCSLCYHSCAALSAKRRYMLTSHDLSVHTLQCTCLQGGDGCSYLDLVHELPGAVGVPQYYLAYDRNSSFRAGVVEPLLERFQSSDTLSLSAGPLTTTYVWIDMFCRNHHLPATIEDTIGITQVRAAYGINTWTTHAEH